MANQYDRDPVLRLIADQLELLEVDFRDLDHQLVHGHQTVIFWTQVPMNEFRRYSDRDIALDIRAVRDHFTDNGVAVTWQVERALGKVSFTLTA